MSSIVGTAIEWAAPYVGTALTSIAVLFAFLQTPWGAKVFDTTFKFYFDRKLAVLKHEQDRTLADVKHMYERRVEELRAELSHLTDRSRHSNEREYQALIAAWKAFITAYFATMSSVHKFLSHANLNQMADDTIDEYLKGCGFDDSARQFIKSSTDKNKAFARAHEGRLLNDAQGAIESAQDILRKQSVFIPADIERKFEDTLSMLKRVWAEESVNFDTRGRPVIETSIAFLKSGEQMKTDLRDIVRARVLTDADRAPTNV